MARGELPLRLPLLRWQLKRAALPLLPEEHRLDAKRSVYRKKKKKHCHSVWYGFNRTTCTISGRSCRRRGGWLPSGRTS